MVVVLTVCIDDMSVHATKRLAPNSGGPCPCGHDPLALHLCAGPLNVTPSAPLRDAELAPSSVFQDRCNCGSATAFSTTAVEHRVHVQLGNCHGPQDHGKPASAPQQGCERPRRTATAEAAVICGRRFSQRAATVGARMSSTQRHLRICTIRTTGKSATVSTN